MRLFFALWPPADTARALGRWAREVQRDCGGRATADETIHLTLAFLGDADPEKAIRAARRVRGGTFDMKINAAKYWKHNRIVWAGPERMPSELADFAAHLHEALKQDGFSLEERPFAAHITLIRKTDPPKFIPPLPAVEWPVNEWVLVKSVTTGRGSRYEPVERFTMGR